MGRYSVKTLEKMRISAKKRIIERPWTNKAGWNKGIKGTHFSPATEFKKGVIPNNSHIFIKTDKKFGGTLEQYKTLHYVISKLYGKPTQCENCGKNNLFGKQIHWANISGRYTKIRSDWKRLCARCHYKFDNQEKRKIKYIAYV